jgi:hypothetical protein
MNLERDSVSLGRTTLTVHESIALTGVDHLLSTGCDIPTAGIVFSNLWNMDYQCKVSHQNEESDPVPERLLPTQLHPPA